MRTLTRRSALAALLAVVLAACGDSTGPDDAVGTYSLRTINGDPVPTVVDQGFDGGVEYVTEITSGSIRLDSDGSVLARFAWRDTFGGSVDTGTDVVTGTYDVDGDAVTIFWDDGGSDGAQLNGSTLTLVSSDVDGTVTLVFRK